MINTNTKNWTIKDVSGNGLRYLATLNKKNCLNEKIILELDHCKISENQYKYWKKYGIKENQDHFIVRSYCYDESGNCSGKYDLLFGYVLNNITVNSNTWAINFDHFTFKEFNETTINKILTETETIFLNNWNVFFNSMGYRERSIWDNKKSVIFCSENGYNSLTITDQDGKRCEYSIYLNRWTN